MQKLQATMNWAIIASEASHVFCCVLPTVFSALSLLAGLGVIGVMPGWLESLHEAIHGREVPMILLSGAVLSLGWGLEYLSRRIDCHDTGCGHGPCGPRKTSAGVVLKAATILFLVNVAVWAVFHQGLGIILP
jgi:hypothetical protein